MANEPPQKKLLGRYELLSELKRGGQGVVYRARLPGLDRPLAIKILLGGSETDRRRFKQEAQVLARLKHKHLAKVLALEARAEHPYVVMEFLEGEDLLDLVRRNGPLDLDRAAELLVPIAETLHFCHGKGIVHRDLKPANVMLDHKTGRPILIDFGLLKRDPKIFGALSQDERISMLTESGEILGTPAYMAPEQTDPSFGPVSPATDVYALGATLYFLLTGKPPFKGKSIWNLVLKVMNEPAPDPRTLRTEIPAHLADLCMRAMAKDAAQRPESARAFAMALAAKAPAPLEKHSTSLRAPGLVLLALVGVVFAVAFLLGPTSDDASFTSVKSAGPVDVRPEPAPTQPEPAVPQVEPKAIRSAERLVEAGLAKVDAGDIQGAIRDFTQAIKFNPESAQAYSHRGFIWLTAREHEDAVRDFSQAIRLDSDHLRAYAGRGGAKVELGKPHSGLDDLNRAIQFGLEDANVYHNRAVARKETGDFKGAFEDSSQAIALQPKNTLRHYFRGVLTFGLKDYRGTVEDCTRALELYPRNDAAYLLRAYARTELGEHRLAALDYEQVLGLKPSIPRAKDISDYVRKHLGREPNAGQ